MALIQLGAPHPPAPLLLAALLLPIQTFLRPVRSAEAVRTRSLGSALVLGAAVAAGALHAVSWERARLRDCRLGLAEGAPLSLLGVAESAPTRGRLSLTVQAGLGSGCSGAVRVVLPREGASGRAAEASPPLLSPGSRLRVNGTWRRSAFPSGAPEHAGELVAAEVRDERGPAAGARLIRRRAQLEERLRRLYPERHGVVSALILARKEGLTPELRSAFARSGTAHLLAISGFHVGVVAAILLGALRAAGAAARPAGVLAAVAVWGYVLFIGAPDAAARAALIVSLFAAGALLGRPLSRPGTVATSFLLLVLWDAGALARPGFQLSFCGVLGLVLLAGPLEAWLRRVLPGEWLRSFRSALAAGVAATLSTLPVVAWHFDQVSLVGIPATLIGTPLVAAAIPGSFASLALDGLHPAAGAFLAGGTDLLLLMLLRATEWLAALPFAVAWIPRAWIFAGAAGAAVSLTLLAGTRRVGGGVRGTVMLAGTAVAVLLLPAGERFAARGTVELLFLDVGQGDAILIRTPAARWLLMDAGPPGGFRSGGDPPVLAELRRLGIRRLEGMLLSHPHLDHIGGATHVIDALPVAAVVDPGMPRGSDAFVQVLESAQRRGSGWRAARAGDGFGLDGVDLRVLNSLESDRGLAGDEVNENSLVILLSFGAFSALLTGDAPVPIEEAAVRSSGPVDLLKVGHHGSHTSTSAEFLEEARPGVAVISVGQGNRYRHPHEPVLTRLREAGTQLYRTDRNGTVRVLARRDGSYTVTTEREP